MHKNLDKPDNKFIIMDKTLYLINLITKEKFTQKNKN